MDNECCCPHLPTQQSLYHRIFVCYPSVNLAATGWKMAKFFLEQLGWFDGPSLRTVHHIGMENRICPSSSSEASNTGLQR